MEELINIQLSEDGKEWSQITEFKTIKIHSEAVGTVCQAISDITGKAVRLTRPFGDVPVDRLNGGFFHPKLSV